MDALSLDVGEYKDEIKRRILRKMKKAATAFVIEALKRVPTFDSETMPSDRSTGFVAGAFNNLKAAIGGRFKAEPFPDPRRHDKVGFKTRKGRRKLEYPVLDPPRYGVGHVGDRIRLTRRIRHPKTGRVVHVPLAEDYYQDVLKTPQSGREFATAPDQIFVVTNNGVNFNFRININYYAFHEVGALKGRGRSPYDPWGSFAAGTEAFMRVMQEDIEEVYPPINTYMTKHTYEVRGSMVTFTTKKGSGIR